MNLIDLTEVAKYIQSNKGKSSVVITSVRTNELADHEAHVGLERKVLRRSANNRVRALAAHGCPPDEAVEVCNRRRFCAGPRQEKVKQWSRRPKRL